MFIIDHSKKFSQFFDKISEKREINFLVLHHIEANSVESAISQLLEHKVSSHFLVDEAGKIFELVDENDVAYHAGVSYWKGIDGLNKFSIGIEFINSSPFTKKFETGQMQAGVELCRYLVEKYEIKPSNIVGHSDIAYDKATNLLDRKQDPSHLFDWKFLAQNGIGIFPQIQENNRKLFELGNKGLEIEKIKQFLQKFGYRVLNLNNDFDQEMQALVRVFNRRFLNKDSYIWFESSDKVLGKLIDPETSSGSIKNRLRDC